MQCRPSTRLDPFAAPVHCLAGFAQVHEGFLHAYQSFRLNLRSTIRELQDKYPELHGENRGRITGHSLGGALATICAYVADEKER